MDSTSPTIPLLNDSQNVMGSPELTVTVFLYGVLISVTVIGNVLVIVSYAQDKEIRKRTTNFIILNLAIADLLVGLVSLTINLSRIVTRRWLFGETVCKLYGIVDYVITNISVAMIVFISLDRYYAIAKLLEYHRFVSLYRVKVSIIATWSSITVYWSLVAFGWPYLQDEIQAVDYSTECYMEYLINPIATFVAVLVATVIPLLSVVILNTLIFLKIKRQWGRFRRIKVRQNSAKFVTSAEQGVRGSNFASLRQNRAERYSTDTSQRPSQSRCRGSAGSTVSLTVSLDHNAPLSDVIKTKVAREKLRRNVKMASKLALYVLIFGACWLPYQIIVIVSAFCSGSCVHKLTWDITENILWANSAINPLLYALTNRRFRRKVTAMVSCPLRLPRN
ncbi:histamine H3 receptor-like [Diadema antillarum]|uniref:histamine H3 receptor-like n=1 Tax=Diadema antillarum TaxID=105358 RepID=UPI003A872551